MPSILPRLIGGDLVALTGDPLGEFVRRSRLGGAVRGVPMVTIPITNDQPGVARRLQWLGLAEVVLPRQLTASRLRQAVERVLGNHGYRERADERAREIAGLDGVHRAADVVEEAFHTKSPVLAGR
jgi:UDP:flavonoid glycosyltransferase YjiC (YdhE family)